MSHTQTHIAHCKNWVNCCKQILQRPDKPAHFTFRRVSCSICSPNSQPHSAAPVCGVLLAELGLLYLPADPISCVGRFLLISCFRQQQLYVHSDTHNAIFVKNALYTLLANTSLLVLILEFWVYNRQPINQISEISVTQTVLFTPQW